jgi:peptidoglycan/xylan/chitin deacetylase (PgdA/CDA1 family)
MSASESEGPSRDLVGYGRKPPTEISFPGDARLVLSIVVNYEEGAEYTVLGGDQRNEGLSETTDALDGDTRDLRVESVYEYGSRAGIWRLARLFDEYGIPITVYACGQALERNPAVGDWIREAGHEPCAHGWRWAEHWTMSREEEREEIRRAIESIDRACGERPVGWYCRYGPGVRTRQLVVEEGGFLYDSDAYNDDLPYFVEVEGKDHLVLPYSLTYNDIKFVLPEGFGGPSDFVDYCNRGIDELLREADSTGPRMMSIGLHSRLVGQPARASALREVIEHALSRDGVRISRRCDIARWCWSHHSDFEPSRPH